MIPDPRSTDIDPSVPLYPLRTVERVTVPEVCHAGWTAADWHPYSAPEVETFAALGRTWRAVGRNSAGVILYSAS